MADNIADLKQRIDLRAVVISCGFRETRSDWADHLMFRQNGKHRIYLSQGPSGVWKFWHPASGTQGSAIDFLRWQKGISVKSAIDELQDWSGAPILEIAKAEITRPDYSKVQDVIARMKLVERSEYLEHDRKIPRGLIQSWRFAGKILEDRRGNIVFPHSNVGYCGGEVRNRNFKGFMRGGTRGLWLSKSLPEDNRIVICESAIDSISHAANFDNGKTRYASLGGAPTHAQEELLQKEIQRMRPGSEIFAATDADAAGDKAAEFIKAACEVALQNGAYIRHRPGGVKDWNEALINRENLPKEPVYFWEEPRVH